MTNKQFKERVMELTNVDIKSGKEYVMTKGEDTVRIEATINGSYYDSGYYSCKEECYAHIIETIEDVEGKEGYDELETKVIEDLRACAKVEKIERGVEEGYNSYLKITMELDSEKVDSDTFSDKVYDIQNWLEDQGSDEVEYELSWRENWYGEDIFYLLKIRSE